MKDIFCTLDIVLMERLLTKAVKSIKKYQRQSFLRGQKMEVKDTSKNQFRPSIMTSKGGNFFLALQKRLESFCHLLLEV